MGHAREIIKRIKFRISFGTGKAFDPRGQKRTDAIDDLVQSKAHKKQMKEMFERMFNKGGKK